MLVMLWVRMPETGTEVKEIPAAEQSADVERERETVGWCALRDSRASHQESVNRSDVLVGRTGEMWIGQDGIKVAALAIDAVAHGTAKCRLRPASDSGPGVRRDIR